MTVQGEGKKREVVIAGQTIEVPDELLAWCTPKDARAYIVPKLCEAMMNGVKLTDEHREKLASFPNLLALLDYHQERYREGHKVRFSVTFGPEADVENVSAELLRCHKELEAGHGEILREPPQ